MENEQRAASDWLWLASLVFMWGSAFIAIKVAVEHLSPLWLVAIRLVIASICMFIFAKWQNIRLPNSWREWRAMLFLGSFGTAIPFILVSYAAPYVPSAIAGLMMATIPFQVLLFSLVFLPEEKATPVRLLSLIIGFLGVAAIIAGSGKHNDTQTILILPFVLLIIATTGYATNGIISRRMIDMPAMTKSYGTILVATGTAILGAILFEPIPTSISWQGWASTAYLAIIPTWVATIVYYRLVDKTSAAFCTQTSYLIPIVAVVLGAIIFQEQLSPIQFAGFFAIIFGLLIAEGILKKRKRRRLPTPPA
ncbi:EamA family transporter [Maritalea porphyrae]|jgi:drug/metabolite transporter (DMT)-like permease|uniref:DMT family transporter n=1 Tax=Maritalea porphyrae TaxID=880732 RepID=UPI0022B05A74|nr:EamA family transporter [Maritalea porphyrae]MCZ4273660.1 EamA family transporter [Maritalea porphyrae]